VDILYLIYFVVIHIALVRSNLRPCLTFKVKLYKITQILTQAHGTVIVHLLMKLVCENIVRCAFFREKNYIYYLLCDEHVKSDWTA